VTRAKPSSAQAEAGNIKLIEGQWNDDFMTELENFPEGSHDDQVDAFSGALNHLSDIKRPRFRTL
jgi:predicted phage terminase large subunit-like protein